MHSSTTWLRRLLMIVVVASLAGSAYAQRNVTLRLNTATLPDTLNTESVVKVMGAVGGTAPFTLPDGNVISWSPSGAEESTLDVTNIGGDYWEITFQVPNDQATTFKFYSQQAEDDNLNGWEADPNPEIGPGTADTTLTLHYFESQSEWHGVSGDRGPYDWRPFESKDDSVGVWFRVAMMGNEARVDGYDPQATDQVIGVRGAPDAGRLDWGVTKVELGRESSSAGQPGYRMYSGIAYFPLSSAGQTQEYKFVLDAGGVTSWEEGNVSGNRSFTIPEEDTTLHWVFYGNTAPSPVAPVESIVVFTVDLRPFETIGLFDRARGDTLWVYGSFNGWQDCPTINPDLCLMSPVPGENQFELAAPMLEVPGTNQDFKYFLDFNDETFQQAFGAAPPSGWEEGHATGTDRRFVYQDQPVQDLGVSYYNDITPANVIPDGVNIDVHFSVDMTPAIENTARPFDPDFDPLYLQLGDPVWGFTQGYFEVDGAWPVTEAFLTDPDGDNVYTGTLTVQGPTYSAINFRYEYGNVSDNVEEVGSDTKTPGRNRTHYIVPNADGSWPTSFTLPEHTFKLTAGPLPFDTNPAFSTGVELLPGEQPVRIALGANYPNPFNPSTAFEYSLTGSEHVTVRVFDSLGRLVATLVDGVQPAATYRVTFDAAHLASGVYLYQLKTPSQVLSRTMVLVK